ncbi:TIGR03943 family putative permease subunit [Longispora albida]|uniref:TIGR03943 family putative permease subunit n=1 Tax=Longispora albida TaxID=203523 RepID=UPI000477CEF4|nr:TIGR03943 family protein [Longispora albida]
MRQATRSVILLLVGGAILKTTISGTYVRYVKEGMWPLLYVAGGAMAVVALVGVAGLFRKNPEAEHDHGGRFDAAWLLMVPMLAMLLLAPPALGSFSVSRSGSALGTAPAGNEFAPLPAGDPVRLSVVDYASRAIFDQGRTLTGRTVRLSGFVITGPGGEAYLARLRINCCAADARPVKVRLTGSLPDRMVPNSWIEVVGQYDERTDVDEVSTEKVPYIAATAVTPIAAPKKAYES